MSYFLVQDQVRVPYTFESEGAATARAETLATGFQCPVELHTDALHPLHALGVGHANPISIITPTVALAPKKPLANLKGHGGGDVRESSCDPKIYPFVIYEVGSKGDCFHAVHPVLGHSNKIGSTRKEAADWLQFISGK